MNQIRLSYILPCYNTGPYIKTCIESLYRQNLPLDDFEVIAVNNAAEDDTEKIILELQEKYPNIKCVKLSRNIYPGGACDEGLSIARGKYVQFVDSDDYLVDGIEGELLKYAEESNLDMVYFNIESFSKENKLTYEDDLYFNGNFSEEIPPMDGVSFIEEYTKAKPYSTMPVPAYRKVIRRTLFSEHNIHFTKTSLANDYLINLQLLTIAHKVAARTIRGYMYRYNENGVTKSLMNKEKNVHALNNYACAYELTKSINNSYVRSTIQAELKIILWDQMSYLPAYNSNELQYIREHVSHKFTIALLGGNAWAKLLYNSYGVYWFKIRRLMCNTMRRLVVRNNK